MTYAHRKRLVNLEALGGWWGELDPLGKEAWGGQRPLFEMAVGQEGGTDSYLPCLSHLLQGYLGLMGDMDEVPMSQGLGDVKVAALPSDSIREPILAAGAHDCETARTQGHSQDARAGRGWWSLGQLGPAFPIHKQKRGSCCNLFHGVVMIRSLRFLSSCFITASAHRSSPFGWLE